MAEENKWEHVRGCIVADDEAAAWLSDVGLASLIDGIFSGEQLTDDFLEAAIEQRHLTKHQVNTVRRRVDTLRKTLKKRRSSRSGPAPPRRDCRDIFANVDPPTPSRDDALLTPPSSLEAAAAAAAAAAAVGPGVAGDHSVGSSGRSRSATPDSMHGSPCQDRSSNENLLDPTAWTKAEHVRRDLTSDEDDFCECFSCIIPYYYSITRTRLIDLHGLIPSILPLKK